MGGSNNVPMNCVPVFICKSLHKAKTPSLGLAEPWRANDLSHGGSAHELLEIVPKGPDTLVASR